MAEPRLPVFHHPYGMTTEPKAKPLSNHSVVKKQAIKVLPPNAGHVIVHALIRTLYAPHNPTFRSHSPLACIFGFVSCQQVSIYAHRWSMPPLGTPMRYPRPLRGLYSCPSTAGFTRGLRCRVINFGPWTTIAIVTSHLSPLRTPPRTAHNRHPWPTPRIPTSLGTQPHRVDT